MALILIVEDEKDMIRGLTDLLEYENHRVIAADEGSKALALHEEASPDLVILDMMLPDMDGLRVCQKIREKDRFVPILVLSARGMEHDIVHALEVGVDDYVKKPFSVAELIARINAILRRANSKEDVLESIQIGSKIIDPNRYILFDGKSEIHLSHYEVEILKVLFNSVNQCVERDVLFKKVWGFEGEPNNRTVDNFIVKLRKKIEDDQKQPRHLITVYGKGYKLIT